MHRKAATAALGTLASLLLCSAPLLAKPTRTIARPAARWTAAPPTLRSSRLRTAQRTAAARPTARQGARPGAHLGPHSSAHATSGNPRSPERPSSGLQTTRAHASVPAPARLHDSRRERALAAQAEIAARSAILAAERAKGSRAPGNEPGAPSSATASSSPGVASGDSALLVNDGGVLRSLPVGRRLKSVEEEAAAPVLLPPLRVASLYDSRGRLILPPPLYGSREVLLHQNEMADHDGLTRVQDDADLLDLRREKKLVPLPESSALTVDYRLPENRRFSRPWTATFLAVLARDYYASFHSPLQVDSAVRTVAVQQRLVRTNGNAAPSTGDTASPHLTGQAVDIGKGGLTRTQIAWLRTYLQPLIDQGKIDVEEEFQQACFHISVYKSFLPATASRIAIAAARQIPADPLPGGPNE
jgi:hypothetical protein